MSRQGAPARIWRARSATRADGQRFAEKQRLKALEQPRGQRQIPQQAGKGQESDAPAAETERREPWVPRTVSRRGS